MDNKTKKEGKNINYWHEPFFEALKFELYDYKDDLEFKLEHKLSEEALRIDVLVVKKNKDIKINKNIGIAFKEHNIFEFKSEKNSLSREDYNKALGYVFLYSAFNKVDIENITLNFVTVKMPRSLFTYLKSLNFKINKKELGIYEILGERIAIQVIVAKNLRLEKNTFLKSLRSNLEAVELENTLKKYRNYKDITDKNIFLIRLITSNNKLFKEVMENMADEILLELEEVFEGTILGTKFKEKGIKEGVIQGKKEGVIEGKIQGKKEGVIEGISYLAKLMSSGSYTLEEAVQIAIEEN